MASAYQAKASPRCGAPAPAGRTPARTAAAGPAGRRNDCGWRTGRSRRSDGGSRRSAAARRGRRRPARTRAAPSVRRRAVRSSTGDGARVATGSRRAAPSRRNWRMRARCGRYPRRSRVSGRCAGCSAGGERSSRVRRAAAWREDRRRDRDQLDPDQRGGGDGPPEEHALQAVGIGMAPAQDGQAQGRNGEQLDDDVAHSPRPSTEHHRAHQQACCRDFSDDLGRPPGAPFYNHDDLLPPRKQKAARGGPCI